MTPASSNPHPEICCSTTSARDPKPRSRPRARRSRPGPERSAGRRFDPALRPARRGARPRAGQLGAGAPRWRRSGSATQIGALAKIDHIVVLMMENRSFDQVLGYLSRELGRTDVNGLNALDEDPNVNPQYNRVNGRNLFPRRAAATAWPVFTGPIRRRLRRRPVSRDRMRAQPDRRGRADQDGTLRRPTSPAAPVTTLRRLRLVMNYFGPDQLPVYAVLANEFGICDRWYTSHAGPTWPNRFVLFTGDLNLDPIGQCRAGQPRPRHDDPAPHADALRPPQRSRRLVEGVRERLQLHQAVPQLHLRHHQRRLVRRPGARLRSRRARRHACPK